MAALSDKRHPDALAFLVLLILGLVTFGPPLAGAGFLNFDDNLYFGPDNAALRQGVANILDPTTTIANTYLPVSDLSLYLDYRLFGANPLGPHVHSLLLHVLAAFLLARLLSRLGVGRWAATAGAGLFLVHPALVESVAWVSSRKDLLSGAFTFASLIAVVRAMREPGRRHAVLAVVWAVLALYAKGTAVVLPLLAAVVAWCAAPAGTRRWPLPCALLAVTLAIGLHHTTIAMREGTLAQGAVLERLAQVPGAYLHYLGKLVWPGGLNVLYPEAATLAAFRGRLVEGSIVLFGVVVITCVALRCPRWRLTGAGLALALLALAPFNTAFPASAIAAADRYLYLAVPGLALALTALPRSVGTWLALLVVPVFAVLAQERSRDFHSSSSLWRASLDVEPRNAVARINLAMDLMRAEPDAARELLAQAAADADYAVHRLRALEGLRDLAWSKGLLQEASEHATAAAAAAAALPPSPAAVQRRLQAWLQAATLASARGDTAASERCLGEARTIAPDDPLVLTHEAALLLAQGVDEKGCLAEQSSRAQHIGGLLRRALAVAPAAFEPNLVHAQLEHALGHFMESLRWFEQARAAAPQRAETYLGKADLYLEQGIYSGAEEAVRQGLAAGAADPALYWKLGLALAGQGQLDQAESYYERFLAVRPRDAGVRKALAAVVASRVMPKLFQLKADELDKAAARIDDLDPQQPKAVLMRAVAERQRRHFDQALTLLERASAALPADDDVARLLAETHRDLGYQLMLMDGDRAAAMDHLRRFVDLAPANVPTEAAATALREEWKRREGEGVDSFKHGELERAERAFRRCLELVPEQRWSCYQLGLVLLQRGGHERLDEALKRFGEAEASQRELGLDPSLPVLYQVITLKQLGRADDAVAVGQRYLKDADAGAARARIVDAIAR